MQPPHVVVPISVRARDDIAAMAVAVQANLVSLKIAASRRTGFDPGDHPIKVPPPGGVMRYRETLLDRVVVSGYSDAELSMRTRQVWGEWTVFCWVFQCDDPQTPADFAHLPAALIVRPVPQMMKKEGAIVTALWRLRHEQRFRFDHDARRDPAFQREREIAQMTPVRVYDADIRLCGNDDLLACACEHAGMLGAIRWMIDDRRVWGEPGIMEIAGTPQPT